MLNEGYISLSRRLTEWRWYQDGNTLRTWIHLLLNANWEDHDFRGITVHRGEMATSYANLSTSLGLSVKQIRVAVGHLKKTGEVASKEYPKFQVFSIINYDQYQMPGQAGGRQGAGKGQQLNKDNKAIRDIYTPAAPEKTDYDAIIAHLNTRAGTAFRSTTEATRRLIHGRLAEGFTVEDFKAVIENQAAAWKNTDMAKYLRPLTLFAPSKFEGYLQAARSKKAQEEMKHDEVW